MSYPFNDRIIVDGTDPGGKVVLTSVDGMYAMAEPARGGDYRFFKFDIPSTKVHSLEVLYGYELYFTEVNAKRVLKILNEKAKFYTFKIRKRKIRADERAYNVGSIK